MPLQATVHFLGRTRLGARGMCAPLGGKGKGVPCVGSEQACIIWGNGEATQEWEKNKFGKRKCLATSLRCDMAINTYSPQDGTLCDLLPSGLSH